MAKCLKGIMNYRIKAYALWLILLLAVSSFSTGGYAQSISQNGLSSNEQTIFFATCNEGQIPPRCGVGDLLPRGVQTPLRFHSSTQLGWGTSSDVLEHFEDFVTIGGKPLMTIYYVATSGSNNGNGSTTEPYRSIQQALDSGLQPGDEVVVRAGTYQEAININTGGSAAANVTLRAEVPGTVTIEAPSSGWNGISVNDNYVTVSGFTVSNANGDGLEGNNVHHVEVLNNVFNGNGESGIQFNGSDFIKIDGNVTYENAADGWFSGISVYQNRNLTGDTSTDEFRTIISNNISYDNVTRTGDHTDGNGIIIDDFQSTQTSGFPSYDFPTLVENNLVYGNGGKGIQVVWSDGVTVRNNTAYHNNNDDLNVGTWRGEISNSQSSNNTFINNIMVADPDINALNTAIDNTSYGSYTNENVVWISNLTFNGQTGSASVRTDGNNNMPSTADGNLLGVNPGFENAPNDFRLSDGSVAIDAGSTAYGLPGVDLDGLVRAVGVVDMGAYEAGSSGAPTSPPVRPTEPTPVEPVAPVEPTDPAEPEAPVNGAPRAADDDGFVTEFETPIRLDVETLLANDSDPDADPLTITSVQNVENGTVTLDGTTILLTPDKGFSGEVSFEQTVSDGNGGSSTARVSVMVAPQDVQPDVSPPTLTPEAPDAAESFSIWSEEQPATPDAVDPDPVTLGLEFTADEDASLEGLRLYLGDANGGPDSIDLWSSDGQLLAHAQVEPSGTEGWQVLTFDEPVQLNAGETYVASYFTTSGGYSVSQDFFTSGQDMGPISFGPDAGVFSYGATSGFPDQTYMASNYWVDLVLSTGTSDAKTKPATEPALETGLAPDVEPAPEAEVTPETELAPETETVLPPLAADSIIGEAGVVTQNQKGSDIWHSVAFDNALHDPSVVMGGMTENGRDPYTVRVRDVTSDGFEYQIDEWDYLDGKHTTESISWLAIESGTHQLEDGRTITAGSSSVGDSWNAISFGDGIFDQAPVVFGQSSSDGNATAVVDRIRDVTSDGFETRLYGEEASTAPVIEDAFDWIAVENGGSASGGSLAGTTRDIVTHKGAKIDFDGNFATEEFVFLTELQTTNGADPATLQTTALDQDMITMAVIEERSQDRELSHVNEDAGFAGFDVAPIYCMPHEVDDSFF